MTTVKKRLTAVLLTAALGCAMLSGCGVYQNGEGGASDAADASGTSATGEKVLRIYADEPPTMDPQKGNSMINATVGFHVYEGLVRNVNGKIEPAGAKEWKVSDDGLTYTFTLNKDAKWSDGQPVKAEEYVYGLQRLVNPDTAAPMAYLVEPIMNAKEITAGEKKPEELGVKAVDDSTIEITLKAPANYILQILSSSLCTPVRKDIVEKYGKDYAATPDKMIFNGPFAITDWQHDSSMTMEKNDSYWNKDRIKLDKIEETILEDKETALNLYNDDQLDYSPVPASANAQYPDVEPMPTGGTDYMQINLESGNKFLANKNFRKALSYGISREETSKLSSASSNKPLSRFIFPGVVGPTDDKTFGDAYPYEPYPLAGDANKAKEYLNKALQELGVSDPAQATFKISYAEGDAGRKKVEVYQEQWSKNLGIKAVLEPVPYATLYENQAAGKFEAMDTGWNIDYADAKSDLEMFPTGAPYNYSKYSSAAFDEHYNKAIASTDAQERTKEFFEAEKVLLDDLPLIPMDARQDKYLVKDNVTNFQFCYVTTSYSLLDTDITA